MDRIHRRRPHPPSSCRRSRNPLKQYSRRSHMLLLECPNRRIHRTRPIPHNCRRRPSQTHRSCKPQRPYNLLLQTHRIRRRRPHPLSSCRRSRSRLQQYSRRSHMLLLECLNRRIHRTRPIRFRRSRNLPQGYLNRRIHRTRPIPHNCRRRPSQTHRSCKPQRPCNLLLQTHRIRRHRPHPLSSCRRSRSRPQQYSRRSHMLLLECPNRRIHRTHPLHSRRSRSLPQDT